MDPLQPTVRADTHRDRSTGLTLFGILTVVLGASCALLVPLMIAGQAMAPKTAGAPPALPTIISGALVYGTLAVVLIWLGIGSVMARRWARALLLIFSWFWLLVGVFTVGMMAILMPQITSLVPSGIPPGQPQLPAAALQTIFAITLIVLSVFMIVLPSAWVLFYRSPHARATCEARDPKRRWTDACPLPVLAVSLCLGMGALSALVMPLAYHGVFPFFGTFLIGWIGSMAYVAIAAIWAFAAWSMYKLDRRGWTLIVICLVVFLVSHLLTYSRHDIIELYTLMGYPVAQLEQLKKLNFPSQTMMLWLPLIFAVPLFGYLIYVRRFFNRPA